MKIKMKEIILATSNQGKIAELTAMLSPLCCIPQQELGITDAEENGLSFVENALIKARHASRLSNRPALADDSGLVVEILNGAPGIYSSRYAGIHGNDMKNIDLLLANLAKIPNAQRNAYFYCAIVLVKHSDDPTPIIATGKLDGSITETPLGTHGFGYDPIFYLPDYQCTAAQLSSEIKNKISHRAHALAALKNNLSCFIK